MKNIAILADLSVATLTACGSKTDANEKNFGAAMTQYFDKKGDLCLNTRRWPVDLSEMDLRLQKTMQAGSANQMAAPEAAGLVKGEDTGVDIMGIMDKPTGAKAKIKRYTLTDAAKPFAQEKEVSSIGLNGKTTEKQTDLCWGKKALEPDEEDDERDAWYRYDEPAIVHYVTDLLPAVAARIKAFSRHYRVDFSKTTQSSYWMNHCEHCGMKQGDFEMYCEPQGAFFPIDERAAFLIVLHEFAEPFGCNGSTAYGDHLFEYMRRA